MESWPDGNRIALTLSVALEAWSPGEAPAYSVQSTPLRPGTVNRSGIAWAQYGGNVGAWRILRTLNRHRVPATFAVSGDCVDAYPDVIATALETGHDVGAHGIVQDRPLAYMTPEEERATIRASRETIERGTGRTPAGWYSPVVAWTDRTTAILADEGFLYQCDANDLDIPRRITIDGKTIVSLPTTDFADNRVLRANPRDFLDAYRDTFDFLYRTEPLAMINMVVHAHTGGRPLFQAVFDQLLAYVRQFPDVWFATHADVARFVLSDGYRERSARERFSGTP